MPNLSKFKTQIFNQNNFISRFFFNRVHGIENLRVIDASVFPTPISGYPNSVLVGMATRGVAFILKDCKKETNC